MLEPKKVIKNGKETWMIQLPIYEGQRTRLFFPSRGEAEKDAEKYGKEVKQAGEYWARLEPGERLAIQVVHTQVKKAGLTMTKVWEDFQAAKKETDANAVKTPCAYADVVTEWKRRKLNAGKSERYVSHAGVDLMKFVKGQERRPINEIRAQELGKWIDAQKIQKRGLDFGKPWGLSTRRTNMALFSSLWKVAIACDWATINIVDKLEPVGKLGRVKEIYPNETTLNLMAATLETDRTKLYLAPMVLGFFGCMRPEEITSEKCKEKGLPKEKWFGWHNIDLKNGLIDVSIDVAKTGDERVIRLQPMAVEWLILAKELGCLLPPVGEVLTTEQICELIGLKKWIRDGLRKNCATHLRVIYKNDYDVVKDLGNSVRTLLKAYAELRTPEALSHEHWLFTPGKVREYRKSRAWKKVLREASAAKNAAIAASATTPAPSASETAKSAS
ncbi:MAG: hypothetical protein ABSF38_16050 [Verrucomicrobiota bacterium]